MRIATKTSWAVFAAAALLLWPAVAHAAKADQQWQRDHARQLDERFAKLAAAATKLEANRLESQIWALWNQSGCDQVDALMWQAQLAMRQGQHQEAVELTGKVIRLSPDYPEGWNLRATVLFFMGDVAASSADIKRTLALEPRHFGALAGMTTINMRAKKWAAALRTLKAALKVHPFLRDRSLVRMLEQRARDGRR